jgi:predicted glycogen debranching enzyme
MALFTIDTNGQLEPHIHQEWLLTNGLGGYAFSTVVGCNTRRYHGLLCAATTPPVGRIMTVNRIGETLVLDGKDNPPHELSVNQFRERFHPLGDRYLRRFELDDTARWEYGVDGVTVIKELQLPWLQNVAVLRYTVQSTISRPVQLSLQPFVSLRDFHAERHVEGNQLHSKPADRSVTVTEANHSVTISADAGSFVHWPDWWYAHVYALETERGQDDTEDLFTPGRFVLETDGSATMTLWIALQPIARPDWEGELTRRRRAIAAASTDPANLIEGPPLARRTHSTTIQKLMRAANDFVVYRKAPDGLDGTTIIAGYPWFADWGRDTMISLPGLLLTTSRFAQAKQVLSVFAQHVSEGMIPNRFDDYTNEPHYNTVDASLWFVHAVFEYLRHSRDQATFDSILHPACEKIIEGYTRGTRFNIHMDRADGLITQGDPTTQLTWMDAKTGGTVFTPRQGKAVEINALWYHALVLMGQKEKAQQVADSFRQAFWINPFRGLYDVVDGQRKDPAVRPNQIFAVSLPNSPLTHDQQQSVVEIVRRELLTPAGLRTLSPTNPGYRGHYSGNQYTRDAAYHNGTVWPWLIGPFLEAYLHVHDHSPQSIEQAKLWLAPLLAQMNEFAIGQVHEICEGESPHRPVGCPAQAWSVAEVLRLAIELGM